MLAHWREQRLIAAHCASTQQCIDNCSVIVLSMFVHCWIMLHARCIRKYIHAPSGAQHRWLNDMVIYGQEGGFAPADSSSAVKACI
jgi:hypothetical protein